MSNATPLRPGNLDDTVMCIRMAIQHVLDAEYLTFADCGADERRRTALLAARTFLESAEFDMCRAIDTLVELSIDITPSL